jgi:hypothetical protein
MSAAERDECEGATNGTLLAERSTIQFLAFDGQGKAALHGAHADTQRPSKMDSLNQWSGRGRMDARVLSTHASVAPTLDAQASSRDVTRMCKIRH